LALFFEEGKKANQCYEIAAMSGCAFARLKLGVVEADAGKFDQAVKHWVIAASQGMKEALDFIRDMVRDHQATREDYGQALKVYKEYMNEVMSKQRKAAMEK
jgi:hypothetical protein